MRGESSRYSRYFTYIKPVTKLPIVRTYGSTIFTLLIMVIFIFFAIKPTVETILVLQKKLENSQDVLEKINKKADDLTKANQNYTDLPQSTKDKIESAIPDYVDLRSLAQILEQTAQKNVASISALQIEPLTIDVERGKSIGDISEVSFTFNVEANYENLISILQDLKLSSRLISIERLSINKVGEGGSLIMSLAGKAYYLK